MIRSIQSPNTQHTSFSFSLRTACSCAVRVKRARERQRERESGWEHRHKNTKERRQSEIEHINFDKNRMKWENERDMYSVWTNDIVLVRYRIRSLGKHNHVISFLFSFFYYFAFRCRPYADGKYFKFHLTKIYAYNYVNDLIYTCTRAMTLNSSEHRHMSQWDDPKGNPKCIWLCVFLSLSLCVFFFFRSVFVSHSHLLDVCYNIRQTFYRRDLYQLVRHWTLYKCIYTRKRYVAEEKKKTQTEK